MIRFGARISCIKWHRRFRGDAHQCVVSPSPTWHQGSSGCPLLRPPGSRRILEEILNRKTGFRSRPRSTMWANRQPPSPKVETPRHVRRLARTIGVHRQRRSKKQPFGLPLRLKSLTLLTLVCSGALGLFGQKGVEKINPQVPAPPTFVDVSQRSRIGFKHESKHSSQKYLLETMGAGVAAFDYNDDGLVDLFFVNAAELRDPMPAGAVPDKSQPRYWNRLYRNDGNGKFSDVTEAAGPLLWYGGRCRRLRQLRQPGFVRDEFRRQHSLQQLRGTEPSPTLRRKRVCPARAGLSRQLLSITTRIAYSI